MKIARQTAEPSTKEAVATLPAIFLSFLKLGTTSFGGGSVGWINREVVTRRGWIPEDTFMQMLTVALAMPGANPVNLAVYVGLHLRGYSGALVAAFGMITPPFFIILLFGYGYSEFSTLPHMTAVLGGLACVGLSAMLLTGIKSAQRLMWHVPSLVIAALVFIAVGVLRLPMIEVVLVAIPVSVLMAYLREKRARHG